MCSIRYVLVLALMMACLASAIPVATDPLIAKPQESLKTANSIGYGYGLGLYYPYHGYDSWGAWGYPYGYGYGYGHGYGSGLYGYWW